MDQPATELPAEVVELLKLGEALGQSQSFTIVSGRCAAASAEALLRLRESRLYLRCASSWREFCPKFLHISGAQADRIIRMWQQHGPAIFELSQLTRISPEFYRAIEPFIKDNALHFNDEAIELDPENAGKIADAVAELRRTMAPAPPKEKPAPSVPDRMSALQKMCQTIVFEFHHLAGANDDGELRRNLGYTLKGVAIALQDVNRQHGLYPNDPNA